MTKIRKRRKPVEVIRTLGDCIGGEIVRIANGNYVVSGPLARGTFIHPVGGGDPTVANNNEPVLEVIEGQDRYLRNGKEENEETDPLK